MYDALIDAGGTSTVVYLKNGNKYSKDNSFGSGNILVNYDSAIINIEKAITHIKKYNNISNVLIGIAGYKGYPFKEKVKNDLSSNSNMNLKFVSDLELAYFRKLGVSEGILVISGTGSSILVKKNNQTHFYGGYGHILGDEGSAYSIVLRALKNLIKEYEEEELSDLSKELLTFFSLKEVEGIKNLVYNFEKGYVASASVLIDKLADLGNLKARNILEEEAKLLSDKINFIIKKHFNKDHLVMYSGSTIEKSKYFSIKVKEAIINE